MLRIDFSVGVVLWCSRFLLGLSFRYGKRFRIGDRGMCGVGSAILDTRERWKKEHPMRGRGPAEKKHGQFSLLPLPPPTHQLSHG